MKRYRFHFLSLMITCCSMALLHSCKEKNVEYPLHTWSEYGYSGSDIPTRDISVICFENDHSLWLGSKNNQGLLWFNGEKWFVYDQLTTGIEFDSITSIVRDGNGLLWVGAKNGLASFNGTTWQKVDALSGFRITSLAVEGIGNIKASIKGSSAGLASLLNNLWSFHTPTNSGIPSTQINAIASDHNQVLWLATSDKGIIRFNNHQWNNISSPYPLLSQHFTSIITAPDGSIWAGSEASELFQFHNDSVTILNTGTSKPITSIIITDDNSIWCSTLGAGLVKFNSTTWTSYSIDNADLPSNDILYITRGASGNLFFSTSGGKLLIIKP